MKVVVEKVTKVPTIKAFSVSKKISIFSLIRLLSHLTYSDIFSLYPHNF